MKVSSCWINGSKFQCSGSDMQLDIGQHSSYCTPDGWESASMSDDDEDGEWVDVHHSSDEDTGEIVSTSGSGVPSCCTS